MRRRRARGVCRKSKGGAGTLPGLPVATAGQVRWRRCDRGRGGEAEGGTNGYAARRATALGGSCSKRRQWWRGCRRRQRSTAAKQQWELATAGARGRARTGPSAGERACGCRAMASYGGRQTVTKFIVGRGGFARGAHSDSNEGEGEAGGGPETRQTMMAVEDVRKGLELDGERAGLPCLIQWSGTK